MFRKFFNHIMDRWPIIDFREYADLEFSHGVLRVAKNACQPIDYAKMREYADYAYADMTNGTNFTLPKVDLRVRGVKDFKHQGQYLYKYGVVLFHCGIENVIRHELFHHWGYVLNLPWWRTINHPDGHSLDGTPR